MKCNHERLFKYADGKCHVCVYERPYKIMQEILQAIGAIKKVTPKTCGSCAEPCGNDWCCMKDE